MFGSKLTILENCYKINVDEKMNIEEWWGWLEIEVNIH